MNTPQWVTLLTITMCSVFLAVMAQTNISPKPNQKFYTDTQHGSRLNLIVTKTTAGYEISGEVINEDDTSYCKVHGSYLPAGERLRGYCTISFDGKNVDGLLTGSKLTGEDIFRVELKTSPPLVFEAVRTDAFPVKQQSTPDSDDPSRQADWQQAIGTWENEQKNLVIELVDLNKANREYKIDEEVKIEGYVRKVPPKWPDKIHIGNLVFISKTVTGNSISGIWIQAAPKGTCPNLPIDWSSCTFTIDSSGKRLTSNVQAKLFWTPKCEWSDKTAADSFAFHRIQ